MSLDFIGETADFIDGLVILALFCRYHLSTYTSYWLFDIAWLLGAPTTTTTLLLAAATAAAAAATTTAAALRDTRCCLLRFLCDSYRLSTAKCHPVYPTFASREIDFRPPTSTSTSAKKTSKSQQAKKNAMYTACLQYMLPFTAAGLFNPSLI